MKYSFWKDKDLFWAALMLLVAWVWPASLAIFFFALAAYYFVKGSYDFITHHRDEKFREIIREELDKPRR